jgi:hypothetical protein
LPFLQANARDGGAPFLTLSHLQEALWYGEGLDWHFHYPNSQVDGGYLSQSLVDYDVL